MVHKIDILLWTFILIAVSTAGLATTKPQRPLSAGGFTLGTSINDYSFISRDNFVKEVIVTDIKGFRKGFVTYGTCERPGEILRIRLKYTDKSYHYFENLLKQYKIKFGSKPKFVGDSFGHIKAWKWVFTGEDGKRVTLTLQHNLKNVDETIGNMVKLGLPDQIIAERKCSNKVDSQTQKDVSEELLTPEWDVLLPQ